MGMVVIWFVYLTTVCFVGNCSNTQRFCTVVSFVSDLDAGCWWRGSLPEGAQSTCCQAEELGACTGAAEVAADTAGTSDGEADAIVVSNRQTKEACNLSHQAVLNY